MSHYSAALESPCVSVCVGVCGGVCKGTNCAINEQTKIFRIIQEFFQESQKQQLSRKGHMVRTYVCTHSTCTFLTLLSDSSQLATATFIVERFILTDLCTIIILYGVTHRVSVEFSNYVLIKLSTRRAHLLNFLTTFDRVYSFHSMLRLNTSKSEQLW